MPVRIKGILDMLRNDGWEQVAMKGGHRQCRRPVKPGWVTVVGKPGDDVAPGAHNSILKQAGLKR